MPVALAHFLYAILGHIVGKVLFSLGIGAVTFVGVNAVLETLHDWVVDQFAGLPLYMSQLMAILELDTAISMILSAYLARIALKTVGGSLSYMRMHGPGPAFSPPA